MHPDIARQLAAERHADLRREAQARTELPRLARRRGRLRRAWRYAGAPTGARTGT
jgi:hypothetical protein